MSPRLKRIDQVLNTHLQAAWRRAVRDGLDPHLTIDREERFFRLIVGLDPGNGRYWTWLSAWRRRQWDLHGVGRPCSLEEIDEVGLALRTYVQCWSRLSARDRDIGAFKTTAELMAVATQTPFFDPPEDDIGNEAMEGSKVLFLEPPWRLVRLDTEAAAQWWGRGTSWCTALRSGNRYGEYEVKGELLVLVAPMGRYQFFRPTGEFKDAKNRDADLSRALTGAPLPLRRIMQELL